MSRTHICCNARTGGAAATLLALRVGLAAKRIARRRPRAPAQPEKPLPMVEIVEEEKRPASFEFYGRSGRPAAAYRETTQRRESLKHTCAVNEALRIYRKVAAMGQVG